MPRPFWERKNAGDLAGENENYPLTQPPKDSKIRK